MSDETTKYVQVIIDLIENENFPAIRGIADYIVLLLGSLDVDGELIHSIEQQFDVAFTKPSNLNYLPQKEWRSKVGDMWLCKGCREKNAQFLNSIGVE